MPQSCTLTGDSGIESTLKFCGDCGSALWTEWPGRPDLRILKAGVLDDDGVFESESMKPKVEQFTTRRPTWLCRVDGALQIDGQQSIKSAESMMNESETAKENL